MIQYNYGVVAFTGHNENIANRLRLLQEGILFIKDLHPDECIGKGEHTRC